MVKHPDASRPTFTHRLYRPLDVASWNDAARVIIGWFMVIVFAVITGGLFALYENLIINVGDTDLRVMNYDYRISNIPGSYYHWHFVNANSCCNSDPVVDFGMCYSNSYIPTARQQAFPREIPECPPSVVFQCYELSSRFCNQTRSVVYEALGISPNGQYSNCSTGGQLRVSSQAIPLTRTTNIFVIDSAGRTLAALQYDVFRIDDPGVQTSIQSFIYRMQDQFGVQAGLQPFTALGNEVRIDGTAARLDMQVVLPQEGKNTIGRWPSAIFTFPGMSARCGETNTSAQFFLQGTPGRSFFVPFRYNSPQDSVSTLEFFNSSATFAQWKVETYLDSSLVQQERMDWLKVSHVVGLEVRVSMVAALGSCYSWSVSSLEASYAAVPAWEGPAVNLTKITIFPPANHTVMVKVQDVSAPEAIALPSYSGMWYIVFCFLCAAFWVWGLGIWVVFGIPLIWWNVRSNAGKPPLVYRYMRRYRGW